MSSLSATLLGIIALLIMHLLDAESLAGSTAFLLATEMYLSDKRK